MDEAPRWQLGVTRGAGDKAPDSEQWSLPSNGYRNLQELGLAVGQRRIGSSSRDGWATLYRRRRTKRSIGQSLLVHSLQCSLLFLRSPCTASFAR